MPQVLAKQFPSFLKGKCPKCRKGNVFVYPLAKIWKFSETNENCPCCKLKFEAEPGFYWGAMYISYGFSVGLLIAAAVLHLSFEWPLTKILIGAPFVAIVFLPFIFRYSRLILLYFISPSTHNYNPEAKNCL